MVSGTKNIYSRSFLLGQLLVHASMLEKRNGEPEDELSPWSRVAESAFRSEMEKVSLSVSLVPLSVTTLPENMVSIYKALSQKYESLCSLLFALGFGLAVIPIRDSNVLPQHIGTLRVYAASCKISDEVDAIVEASSDEERNKLLVELTRKIDNWSSQRVFISYIHENKETVQRLYEALTSHGIAVWLDRSDIQPGRRWKDSVRRAIQRGSFFIACFSKEYNERNNTYMNEELTLAIEELRQRPADRSWFIPVKLSECEIPDRNIGAGEVLRDTQWVELYEDWGKGIQRILSVIQSESPEG